MRKISGIFLVILFSCPLVFGQFTVGQRSFAFGGGVSFPITLVGTPVCSSATFTTPRTISTTYSPTTGNQIFLVTADTSSSTSDVVTGYADTGSSTYSLLTPETASGYKVSGGYTLSAAASVTSITATIGGTDSGVPVGQCLQEIHGVVSAGSNPTPVNWTSAATSYTMSMTTTAANSIVIAACGGGSPPTATSGTIVIQGTYNLGVAYLWIQYVQVPTSGGTGTISGTFASGHSGGCTFMEMKSV